MRCLSCHYDLKNLPENRCPECGREFDPTDPSTFDIHAPIPLIPAIIVLALIGSFVAFGLVSFLFQFFDH